MSDKDSNSLGPSDLHSFEFIFQNLVLPLAEDVANKADPSFKISCSFEMLDSDLVYHRSHVFYRKKREMIKKYYYGSGYEKKNDYYDDDNYLLDIHKIASIICSTLLQNKLFWFDEKEAHQYLQDKNLSTNWKINNILINYKLAVNASFSLIYNKMLFDLYTRGEVDTKMYREINNQQGLFLYPPNDAHESFENSIILNLAKRDIENIPFDYLLYSALLYQLEEYNKVKFKEISNSN